MTDKQLFELSLDALENIIDAVYVNSELEAIAVKHADIVIAALKERLAEHAMREVQRLGQEIEQEPVAWINPDEQNARKAFHWVKSEEFSSAVYTTPPQRKPLTDKAITQVIDSMPKKMKGFMVDWDLYEFARAIEAAHGIKENQ